MTVDAAMLQQYAEMLGKHIAQRFFKRSNDKEFSITESELADVLSTTIHSTWTFITPENAPRLISFFKLKEE
jgi:hypothetical protein